MKAYFHLKQFTPNGEELINELLEFSDDKIVAGILHIDEVQEKWYVGESSIQCNIIYNFSDVEEVYSLKGDKIMSSASSGKKKSGIARGIVGGVIGGTTGALIGTLTASTETSASAIESQTIYINIFVSGRNEPMTITCPNEMVADSVQRAISSMIKDPINEKKEKKLDSETSNADELRKFKGLLDDGIISQEEFDIKKKQLLDL